MEREKRLRRLLWTVAPQAKASDLFEEGHVGRKNLSFIIAKRSFFRRKQEEANNFMPNLPRHSAILERRLLRVILMRNGTHPVQRQ